MVLKNFLREHTARSVHDAGGLPSPAFFWPHGNECAAWCAAPGSGNRSAYRTIIQWIFASAGAALSKVTVNPFSFCAVIARLPSHVVSMNTA